MPTSNRTRRTPALSAARVLCVGESTVCFVELDPNPGVVALIRNGEYAMLAQSPSFEPRPRPLTN